MIVPFLDTRFHWKLMNNEYINISVCQNGQMTDFPIQGYIYMKDTPVSVGMNLIVFMKV